MDVSALVEAAGGFATTRELHAAGVSEQRLTLAVREGRLHRVRRGWYSTRAPADRRFVAVSLGGVLTGVSAVDAMGGWVWRHSREIHVSVAPNASRFVRPDRVVVHWEEASERSSMVGIASLHDALVRVALDADLETAVGCLDWAVRAGMTDLIDVERILLALPGSARGIARLLDPRSQSVLESVARVRLLLRGWSVVSQVRVGDVSAIDLVIENQVALELDGRAFHEATFERDRRKDLAITAEGRHSIRVSASMVRDEWPSIERAIEAALRARGCPNATGFSGLAPRKPRGNRRATPLLRFDS
jgi:very-short-patch-repair endonuclease